MLKRLLSKLHAPVYRKRLEVLTDLLLPHLREGDAVLDVGCGSGQLAFELSQRAAKKRINVRVSGLERFPRGEEPIPVIRYDGKRFPFPDRTFDMVIVADVLHHENDPDALLRECIRASKRCVVIKDHQLAGPLAKARVSFIDWAANAPYGVACLYRYKTPAEWHSMIRNHGLAPIVIYPSIDLYPAMLNLLFGRRLQILAICRVPEMS
jgi:ubiquinone/menaquinone biosynthesis C-methylase UbiE